MTRSRQADRLHWATGHPVTLFCECGTRLGLPRFALTLELSRSLSASTSLRTAAPSLKHHRRRL